MKKTRTILTLAVVLVTAAATLSSGFASPSYTRALIEKQYRLPPAWWNAVSVKFQPAQPPDMVTFTAMDECRLVDESGNDVSEIWVQESTPIQWVNKTQKPATIFFNDLAITGWDHIYLRSGESRVTTTRSGWSAEANYQVIVKCGDIQGPTPPIKECPPPPEPCP
jgi:hypothetical protein